jgi:hypothetical protein
MNTAMRSLVAALAIVVLVFGCRSVDAVTVGPEQMPAANVGQPFEVTFEATAPGAFYKSLRASVTNGNLPPGLTVFQMPSDGSSAAGLRGTPTTAGSYAFTVDLSGCSIGCQRGSRDYTLVVSP